MAINKTRNSYQNLAGADVYADCPKAVWVAIANSFALQISGNIDVEDFGAIRGLVLEEWRILHDNGIVPQPVPGKLLNS